MRAKHVVVSLLAACVLFSLFGCANQTDQQTGGANNESIATTPTETIEPTIEPTVSQTIDVRGNYYTNKIWNGESLSDAMASTPLTLGDRWPESVNIGDVFVFDGMAYVYGMAFNGSVWVRQNGLNGWWCGPLNREGSLMMPSTILTEVNHEPVVSMSYAYADCVFENQGMGIIIPSSVYDVKCMFKNASMASFTNITIPKNLTNYTSMLDVAPSENQPVINIGGGDFNIMLELSTLTINATVNMSLAPES